jgi:polyphosphate kinase 2
MTDASADKKEADASRRGIAKKDYKHQLKQLQIELVKLQRHFIAHGDKILVLIEGRDAAGKDGVIKRVVQHLSPRETRVVALGKPSDRETASWYFQRWVAHLPTAGEFVLFNRSWYNRAGVERVMGFATEAEIEAFFDSVLPFEEMLVRSGIKLFKYFLDISRDEQAERIKERRSSPLTRWKESPIDAKAVKLWDDYSDARNAMLARTDNAITPWTLIHTDYKRLARLNLIRDVLLHLDYEGKDADLLVTDPEIVFGYERGQGESGALYR